jgi:hypothetical protein
MTNEEIKKIVSLDSFFRVITQNGETFIGIIDGPYSGHPKAKLVDYQKDYLYVTLINNQQQTLRIHSENIEKIEKI